MTKASQKGNMNDYLLSSKRLNNVLDKGLFYLSNTQIINWLNISDSLRRKLFKDLKDKRFLPDVKLRGLANNKLAIFWEYYQLIKKTDRTTAYLEIDNLVRELKLNE